MYSLRTHSFHFLPSTQTLRRGHTANKDITRITRLPEKLSRHARLIDLQNISAGKALRGNSAHPLILTDTSLQLATEGSGVSAMHTLAVMQVEAF